jgi:hypothetical protein
MSEWKPLLCDSLAAFFVWSIDPSDAPDLLDFEKPSFYQIAKEIMDEESTSGDALDDLMNMIDGGDEGECEGETNEKGTVEKWKAGELQEPGHMTHKKK